MVVAVKIFGWTDEVTACDCCGKTDLSGTFGVETETGEILHHGSTCVVRNLGFKDRKAFNKAAREDQDKRQTAALHAWRATAEYAAEQVAFDAAHAEVRAGRLEIGRAFRDRVAPVKDASDAKRAEIKARFGVTWF